MTDEEIDHLREEMDEQRRDIRTYLANEGVDVSRWRDGSVDTTRADGGDSG